MIGFTTVSLTKLVVPRTVLTVWLAESRIGRTSSRRMVIRLWSWKIRTIKKAPITSVSRARRMIKMSRTDAVVSGYEMSRYTTKPSNPDETAR